MGEWILILAIFVNWNDGQPTAAQVPGFGSKVACEKALIEFRRAVAAKADQSRRPIVVGSCVSRT